MIPYMTAAMVFGHIWGDKIPTSPVPPDHCRRRLSNLASRSASASSTGPAGTACFPPTAPATPIDFPVSGRPEKGHQQNL